MIFRLFFFLFLPLISFAEETTGLCEISPPSNNNQIRLLFWGTRINSPPDQKAFALLAEKLEKANRLNAKTIVIDDASSYGFHTATHLKHLNACLSTKPEAKYDFFLYPIIGGLTFYVDHQGPDASTLVRYWKAFELKLSKNAEAAFFKNTLEGLQMAAELAESRGAKLLIIYDGFANTFYLKNRSKPSYFQPPRTFISRDSFSLLGAKQRFSIISSSPLNTLFEDNKRSQISSFIQLSRKGSEDWSKLMSFELGSFLRQRLGK